MLKSSFRCLLMLFSKSVPKPFLKPSLNVAAISSIICLNLLSSSPAFPISLDTLVPIPDTEPDAVPVPDEPDELLSSVGSVSLFIWSKPARDFSISFAVFLAASPIPLTLSAAPPASSPIGYKTKRGATFEGRTVEYILSNPFYYGAVRWNRQNHDNHTIKDISEWIIVMGKHPAIIDKETWDLVQHLMALRSKPYKARAAGHMKHWLGGIVKCSDCGASLMAGLNATRYQCGNYNKGKCLRSHFIKTAALEQAVYNAFERVFDGTTELHYELKKASNEANTNDRDILLSKLSKLDDKEARIKQAYRDGIDTIEEYKENKQLLNDERKALEKQLEAFSLASDDSNADMLKNISTVYDIIKDTSNDTLTRANAIRSVVDHMVYDKENDKLEVYFFLQK